jgi:DNA adenine methylase
MRFNSPLRYPGGKAFLASEFERILAEIGMDRPTYVEPYAGGAGAALTLLFAGKVRNIVINDYDKAIYSFWRAVTEESGRFAKRVLSTPISVSEWKKQRKVYEDESTGFFERGFATFFLNRTNRSGVMNAWPIGGLNQSGNYKIDARFNRKDLAARILKIGEYRGQITVLNEDGIALTKKYLKKENTFIYLDPPYFKKGAMLYLNHYVKGDHEDLAELLNANPQKDWVLTYDQRKVIRNLYPERNRRQLSLKYRVHDSKKAHELMIFSDTTFV